MNNQTGAKARILAYLKASVSPIGETSQTIREATGLPVRPIQAACNRGLRTGEIHAVGALPDRRLFGSAEQAEQCRAAVDAHIDRAKRDRAEHRRQYDIERNKTDARRKAKQAASKKSRRILAASAKRTAKEQAAADALAIKQAARAAAKAARAKPIKSASPKQIAALEASLRPQRNPSKHKPCGEVIVPPHVKVQICPGYPGDTRYMVTGPVVGGFVSQWRTLRGER